MTTVKTEESNIGKTHIRAYSFIQAKKLVWQEQSEFRREADYNFYIHRHTHLLISQEGEGARERERANYVLQQQNH